MSITFKIKGLENALKKVDPKEHSKKVSVALDKFGLIFTEKAKQYAPVNEGHLRASIDYEVRGTSVSLNSRANYSAYVEFGTRRFAEKYVASLPADWKTYASSFKGSATPGTMDEFIQNIMKWVLAKGIGAQKTKSDNISKSKKSYEEMQSAAYAIAINILQNGIKPHPFMYPAYNETIKQLYKYLGV